MWEWVKLDTQLLWPGFHMSYHMDPFPHIDTFWRVWERGLLKTFWEKEKLLVQAISPFPKMFSSLSKTEIIIFVTFNLLSGNVFNLVWSKILSCGNGLNWLLNSCGLAFICLIIWNSLCCYQTRNTLQSDRVLLKI